MSSTAARRTRRRIEKDKRLGRYVEPANPWGEKELDLPTEKDVEDYILDKTRELRFEHKPIKIENNVQLS
jgi:hypothetical protein